MRKSLLIIISFFISFQSFGYEVDNFTQRSKLLKMKDSINLLNAKTNKLLASAMVDANDIEECTVDMPLTIDKLPLIFGFVKEGLNTEPLAFIEDWLVENDKIDQYIPEWDIYDDPKKLYKKYESVQMINKARVLTFMGLEPTIKVGSVLTGVDKFGHFLAEGFSLFEIYNLEKKPFEEVFKYNNKLENGFYGLENTGIFSYADLAAGFKGMSFWSNLVSGNNPYFSCKSGKYVQTRLFDWANYVDNSWDEGINCSRFIPVLTLRVSDNLKQLNLSCPISKDKCMQLEHLNCANRIINKMCSQYFDGSRRQTCIAPKQSLVIASLNGAKIICKTCDNGNYGQNHEEEESEYFNDLSIKMKVMSAWIIEQIVNGVLGDPK